MKFKITVIAKGKVLFVATDTEGKELLRRELDSMEAMIVGQQMTTAATSSANFDINTMKALVFGGANAAS